MLGSWNAQRHMCVACGKEFDGKPVEIELDVGVLALGPWCGCEIKSDEITVGARNGVVSAFVGGSHAAGRTVAAMICDAFSSARERLARPSAPAEKTPYPTVRQHLEQLYLALGVTNQEAATDKIDTLKRRAASAPNSFWQTMRDIVNALGLTEGQGTREEIVRRVKELKASYNPNLRETYSTAFADILAALGLPNTVYAKDILTEIKSLKADRKAKEQIWAKLDAILYVADSKDPDEVMRTIARRKTERDAANEIVKLVGSTSIDFARQKIGEWKTTEARYVVLLRLLGARTFGVAAKRLHAIRDLLKNLRDEVSGIEV